MQVSYVKKTATLIALATLAACGGGSGSAGQVVPPFGVARPAQSSILKTIVGVGDSLTAGYQSNGFLGETGVPNPYYHYLHQVPPSQENGWWADLDEQASGQSLETAIANVYDASVSPLPLIKGPGLDSMLVPSVPTGFPFQPLKTGDVCTDNQGFDQAGYHLKGVSRVRLNPNSTTIRDIGIPGLTLHEANVMHQPQTSTCKSLPGIPGLLNQVIAEESGTFWPVLGNFTKLGPHLTPANAAASRHPTLATVWLGANDVLKFMGSGGRFVGGDRTAGQAASDLNQTIATLQHAGARVVVANLPNILETGYFQRVTIPAHQRDCKIRTYATCLLAIPGVPPQVVTSLAKTFGLDTPQGCIPASESKPCGYLTLPSVALLITYFNTYGQAPDLDCAVPAPNCKAVARSGLGPYYITPEFAGRIQALNNVINQGIDDAAKSSRVPLVDVTAIFHGLASGNPANPYFRSAASINPGLCCTLGFLWGILSFDGIHPSNTGYALIAYDFIKTINAAYGTHIPEIDIKAVYDGTRCSTKRYCFPDPYAPPYNGV
jgi:lysophospholipase L1-like esterase